ncbi:MAG: CRISPR-associated endonuclease Cas1 [Acidobacteriota bacterium]|jgi:CRISPR-associated protein Cas1|nr:CRISPR-associated endonuclease Cas1 [Acidobacteriota bacterium]
MSRRSLALFEQGLRVTRRGGLLRVERSGEAIAHARLEELDEILAFGDVQLDSGALLACLERGVDVQVLTARGEWRGRWAGRPGPRVALRLAQFARLSDAAEALRLARAVVAGKLANQRTLLLRVQRSRQSERVARAIAELRLRAGDAAQAASLEALRGVEGLAAAAYFAGLAASLLRPDLPMHGRSRRPPRDAPNAVLSFGYTLLLARVESAVLQAGLDPYLGALHAARRGQPSLALDLMEEFRPVLVDALLLRLMNRRELAPEDFAPAAPAEDPGVSPLDDIEDEADESEETRPPGVWLSESGRRIFFRAWGRRLHESHDYPPQERALAFEEIIRQQVQHFGRVLLGLDPFYMPFAPR